MSILNIFRKQKSTTTASIAKERLQIIVAHERGNRNGPEYLPALQREIIDVIAKYVNIDKEKVLVSLQNSGDCAILELNVTLPEQVVSA